MPAFPPVFPLLLCLAVLAMFGIGFNALVAWVNRKRAWPVSFSVVIGVLVTLAAPTVFFWNYEFHFWQAGAVYLASFAASGIPMVYGNVLRQTKSHKRRRLPTSAIQVRDSVVMELHAMIEKIVKKEAEVADLVHRLHEVIGSLKSL